MRCLAGLLARNASRLIRTGVFAASVVSLAAPVLAQGALTFDLSGTVKDQQGGVLPGVSVTMRNEGTGYTRAVQTDAKGGYYFAALPPQGTWQLTMALSGFAPYEQRHLEFVAGAKQTINATMTLTSVQENVVVTAESPLVDTSQALLASGVSKEQIEQLPLAGRNYFNLALLGSGVSDVGTDAIAGKQSQVINGAYSRYTSYTLDGFNNTRDQHGVERSDLPIDAMSEFKVLTNQFSAEYGETVGGIVTAVSKSGGNTLHGSLSYFGRPGSWTAPNLLTGVKAPVSYQDFSGTAGGPLKKDQAFYFGAYEYRHQSQNAVVTTPVEDGRFQGSFPLTDNLNSAVAKLDYNLSQNNRLEAKFVLGRDTGQTGVGGLNPLNNLSTNITNSWDVDATYTSLFSNNQLNELRVAYSREDVITSTGTSTFTPNGVALSYPGLVNLGSYSLQTSPDRSIQLADSFTLHAASHSIKIGGNTRSSAPGGQLLTNINGQYTFAPGAPFPYDPNNPKSYPIQYSQGFYGVGTGAVTISKWHYAAFVQDDWKTTDRFTLNLGLRYQYETLVAQKDAIDPRLGFAWDVNGDGRTVLRGGAGIFHGTIFSTINAFEEYTNPNGFRNIAVAPGQPGFPAYPNTLPGPNIPATIVAPPGNFYIEAPQYAPSMQQEPKSNNFTLGLVRQLSPTLSVSVDLTYNRGADLLEPTDVNSPTYFDYSTGLTRTAAAGDASRPFGVPAVAIQPGQVSYLPNGYPETNYRQLLLVESVGESRYGAVAFTLNKRLSSNLTLQSQYTWSRATNDGDGFRANNLPLNPNDRNAEWGRSATDVPQQFSVNGVYKLPLGIQVAAIVRAHSGSAVNPTVGTDLNGDGVLNDRPFANGTILPRNSFRAPAFAEFDLGASKFINLGGRRVELRLDGFNLTNHENPLSINSTYGPNANSPLSQFLTVQTVAPGRQYQMSARFLF